VEKLRRQGLIAIDWGTNNFRYFRLDEAGEIIEMRVFPSGVLRVEEGRFAENATRTSG
jgi:2-dehydro-3-deoxygalactonokinase